VKKGLKKVEDERDMAMYLFRDKQFLYARKEERQREKESKERSCPY